MSKFVMTVALAATAWLPSLVQAQASLPTTAQLGPRPFFLVNDMADSALKTQLQACTQRAVFTRSNWSIGHRGAALQFPEHTKESYEAAARMGAGIVECDVTFTKDKELVCRHAQNDLHTTTNILATPLASKCIKPFTPATFDANGNRLTAASAECRTSELTLAEFKTLRGKMDAANPNARTVAEYLNGTATFRTDLYSGVSSGTLLTHKESIELFKRLGVKMTPELKSPSVPMPFEGFSQQAYAQKMIDEYKAAGVPPRHVWPQSFDKNDVLYWVQAEPAFGRQAVYLDDANTAEVLFSSRFSCPVCDYSLSELEHLLRWKSRHTSSCSHRESFTLSMLFRLTFTTAMFGCVQLSTTPIGSTFVDFCGFVLSGLQLLSCCYRVSGRLVSSD